MGNGLKKSRYAVAIDAPEDVDAQAIAYCAATGALALLGADEVAALEDPASAEAAVVEGLCAQGFLVDSELDELAAQRRAFAATQDDPAFFSLVIAPTYACNLRCPYCYEEGRSPDRSVMDEAVQDGIVALAEKVYADAPFTHMDVEWYGGEPLLGAKVVERLSKLLIAFCDERGVDYTARIITNGTLVTEEQARMLADNRVEFALVTIDGPDEVMNRRRPAADGSDSFAAAIEGIRNLLAAGIRVQPSMNVDKVNIEVFEEAAAAVRELTGLELSRTKLNDYQRTFGCGKFCTPEFDLYDHPEYARMESKRFAEERHVPAEYQALMTPAPYFCTAQLKRNFVVDVHGDVFRCDGYMGNPDHLMFNVADLPDVQDMLAISEYPFDQERCVRCELLPICKGTCRWERECCEDHACHPLKYTMDEYLIGWARAVGQPTTA